MQSLYDQLAKLQAVDYIIICLAVFAYIPLWRAIKKDPIHGAGQNFWTWILWFILDVTQFASIYVAGGVWVMFVAYTPCCFVTLLLVSKHRKKIDATEIIVFWSVFICIIIWFVFGAIWAIIFQTASQVIAGYPLLRDTYRWPYKFTLTLFPLMIFLTVHFIAFYRKSGWSIKNTLFPTAMGLLTLLTILPIILYTIKEKKEKKLNP